MTDVSLRLERLECAIDDIKQQQKDLCDLCDNLSERLEAIESSAVDNTDRVEEALEAIQNVEGCSSDNIDNTRHELRVLIDELKDTVDDLTVDVERLSEKAKN